ncbi:TraM recognition domain-containing protein, partial [uncultured Duncaniella sp.]
TTEIYTLSLHDALPIFGNRDWVFATTKIDSKGEEYFVPLTILFNTKIQTYPQLKCDLNPFDPEWTEYREKQRTVKMKMSMSGKRILFNIWKRQNQRCPICGESITAETPWHTMMSTVNGKNKLSIVHESCYLSVTHKKISVRMSVFRNNSEILLLEPCDGKLSRTVLRGESTRKGADLPAPDLSTIAYNHLMNHLDGYKVKPKFYVINFDDPRRSHRCNPIHPDFMTDISDAYESAYTIMLNLNKTWVQKQGDFFVESPIILFAAIIWYLRIYKDGKYCTFPHAIELLNRRYEDVFPILTSYPELENYLSPFMDAWQGGAMEQLAGQIASAKIPLSRMISPQLYWVMSDSEFTLDINNPDEPKILVVGNNPDRQNIYGAALGLYNSRIVKLINKKGMLKSSVIIDELPTIYFKGLDNLIATARSNKVAICLGFQDFSQLVRDYGDREAKVVMNTVGNIFSGQVVGETAKTLSERFGKVLQKRQSISINRQDVSTSINTQMDSLIPPSKISGLTQGMFVGSVSDNFNERIEQKIFHAEIVVDSVQVKHEESNYKKIPVITDFTNENGNDCMKEMVQENYNRIKEEVKQIVKDELERITNDDNLKHLLQ